MPITIAKAYEIINLNINQAGKKMAPDVKDSLHLALSALAFVAGARAAGTVKPDFLLKGETLQSAADIANQPPHNVLDRQKTP
jgi:hypothetical protein